MYRTGAERGRPLRPTFATALRRRRIMGRPGRLPDRAPHRVRVPRGRDTAPGRKTATSVTSYRTSLDETRRSLKGRPDVKAPLRRCLAVLALTAALAAPAPAAPPRVPPAVNAQD